MRRSSILAAVAPLFCAVAAALALRQWLRDVPRPPAPREPSATGSLAEARSVRTGTGTDLRGTFAQGDGVPATSSAAWPGFRGPRRDNVVLDEPPLLAWVDNGPVVSWQVSVGDGHAAPAVRDGRVYLLDYDEVRGGDVLRCLSLDDGREIWQRFYAVRSKRNHGISRTIPAVSERHVVSLGPQCHVLCADARDGAFRWGMSLVTRFGSEVPLWYAGQCPFIDADPTHDIAVLAPAGPQALLAGVDCASGEVLWQTPNPEGWRMSHSSVMCGTFHGVRQYLYAAIGGIAGVAADGPERGTLLWRTDTFAPSVVAPSPVVLPGNRFLQTAGYGAGSVLFEVQRTNETGWCAVPVARLDRRVFACEQQTPVWRDGLLFSVLPNDAGGHRQELACLDAAGTVRWTSGPQDRFGLGPYLAVGSDQMLLLDDRGVLTLARTAPEGYSRLSRLDVFQKGRDAWGPMALADGRLLLRDSTRLICLELRPRGR